MLVKLNMRAVTLGVMVLYAIELLDELIYGMHGAALPLIKSDLALTYTQVGLLATIPGLVSIALEPFIGVLGDTRWRRALVRGGIIATTFGLALTAFGQTFAVILAAFTLLYVASGAYVNLAQATLMDTNPARTEHAMARWTLVGSIGVTVAPILATIAFGMGYGWRGLYLAFAGAAGVYIALVWRVRFDAHAGAEESEFAPGELLRALFAAVRNRELLRWVLLTELADLMLDKLYEVTGLYFHDVVGVDFTQAAFASAVFTITGLVGNLLLIPLLEQVNGLWVLRLSSFVVAGLYAAFLLIPDMGAKYVLIGLVSFCTAGWFAILRGRTYAALPGQSGMVVAITAFANISILLTPTILGAIADAVGLQAAMWLLILGPLALIVGLPRRENGVSENS
ncbi:MAG TPA: MFS transporter [Anaerolineae bacterium]|nr:MFS transporter [Anaerolineae bacterium]